MGGWVSEWVSGWTTGGVVSEVGWEDECMSGWVSEWESGWRWMSGRVDRWVMIMMIIDIEY